ncbi:MAG: radical SAM protein [Syntrophales bacterium]|nr:radical SAM protein [Syntrophales bacterium]
MTKRPLTVEELRHSGLPVIIFGAGAVGEALLHACSRAGVSVDCFCDNSVAKSGCNVCGVPVIHTSQLNSKYPDAVFLISVADINDIVSQLQGMRYEKWATCEILKKIDLAALPYCGSLDFVSFLVNTCLLCHKNYLSPEKLFMHSVDLIVTERCSLRCRDCSNLMQYYKKPRDCSLEEMYAAIDALCGAIDEINDFRVIGGEPLMNRDVHLLVRKLVAEAKVNRIVIYTNGTLLPRPEQLDDFRDDKTLFLITNYGKLSRKLKPLIDLLEREKIAHYVHPATGWTACSGIVRHVRTPEQQQHIFAGCCTKNLFTLNGNRLYRCPFIANAARLKAIPDIPSDYVELLAENPLLRLRLKEYIARNKFMEGCDYCDGRPWDGVEIPPAIQTDHPLPYQRFET